MMITRRLTILLAALVLTLSPGCSVRRFALNKVADTLATSGSTFSSDNDPELIADALPFSLKLMESVLAENPNHTGLLTSLASGFTQYAFAFVQQEAERVEDHDLDRAWAMHRRARNMYLRARDYALRGLDATHPGFSSALRADPDSAVRQATPDDVPLLYWAAASWAAAIAQSKDDPALIGDLPKVEALIDRALALDEDWGDGSIHSFLITYEMNRATAAGDPVERATRHFERAVELTSGRIAGPYVSYAEAVAIPTENRDLFLELLERALEINPDADPNSRLENIIMQRRARWLLDRVNDLFLPPLEE